MRISSAISHRQHFVNDRKQKGRVTPRVVIAVQDQEMNPVYGVIVATVHVSAVTQLYEIALLLNFLILLVKSMLLLYDQPEENSNADRCDHIDRHEDAPFP